MNNIAYFKELANISDLNYIVHYDFNEKSFSGAYVLNSGYYSGLSGFVENKQLVNTLIHSGYIKFDKNNPSKINIPTGSSYTTSDAYTFILNYEQTGNNVATIFSSLYQKNGKKFGFNICINQYNDLAIEYYRNGIDYTLKETNFNLDTKGLFFVKGNTAQINFGYYNITLNKLIQESYSVELQDYIFESGITIGESIETIYGRYNGLLKNFIFINRNINDTELQIILDQFIYVPEETYVYQLYNDVYSSSFSSPFVSGIFNEFSQFSNSCLTKTFLEQSGNIKGLITGETINGINYISGKINFYNYESLKEPLEQFFAGVKVTGKLTGYEERLSLTGYQDIEFAKIYDACKDERTNFILRSGLFGPVQVITGIENLTGYVEETYFIPKGTIVLTGYESGVNKTFSISNENDIKYIYQFEIQNNLSYLSRIENIEFISSPLNESFSVSRTSDYGYEKTISLIKNNKFIQSLGVENLIINYDLSSTDIIEIYNFDKNSTNLLINEKLYLSRASRNVYIGLNERQKSINFNGLNQIPNLNYSIIPSNILLNYSLENSDYIDMDHIKNTGSELVFEYIGQNEIINGKRDFIYLNGQKLISGINYNINNNKTIINKDNTPSTGIIHAFNSLYGFNTITGDEGFYSLSKEESDYIYRFFKGSNLVWLNGVKLNKEDFIEVSKNDPFYNPVFNTKPDVIIYDNDQAFFNM